MEASTITPGSVVVGVDGSDSAAHALSWAVEQASLEGRPVTLVHAVDPSGPGISYWTDRKGHDDHAILKVAKEAGQHLLDKAVTSATEMDPDVTIHSMLQVADPRQVLLDVSKHASMIVLGSRGRGPVRSLLMGSVSFEISRHAHCPVVVLRPTDPVITRHGVLVGTDCTENSQATVEFAAQQASLHGLDLTVVYSFFDLDSSPVGICLVPDDFPGLEEQRLKLAESVSGLAEKYPDITVRARLARGLADECLVDASATMDMLVVGHHRSSLVDGFGAGSVAMSVVERAACPVVVVPGRDLQWAV